MTANKKLLFDQVVSIKPVWKKQCYDFEIPVVHNFFANEILVHNSGGIEENADAILIGARQNFDKTQTAKDKSDDCEYDVWIAKHRRGPESKITLTFRPPCFEFLEPAAYGMSRHPALETIVNDREDNH